MASPKALERRWAELRALEALMMPGDDHLDPLDRGDRHGPEAGWAAGLSSSAGSAGRRRQAEARASSPEHVNVHSDQAEVIR
jgi:hypothetical protein